MTKQEMAQKAIKILMDNYDKNRHDEKARKVAEDKIRAMSVANGLKYSEVMATMENMVNAI